MLSTDAAGFIEHFRALDDTYDLPAHHPAEFSSTVPQDFTAPSFLDLPTWLRDEYNWDNLFVSEAAAATSSTTPSSASSSTTFLPPQVVKTESIVYNTISAWIANGRCNTPQGTLNLKQAAYLLLVGIWTQDALNVEWGLPSPAPAMPFQSSILLGGPGTGKTYITNLAKDLINHFFPNATLQSAFTHRAARLVQGTTLHASLGLQPDSLQGKPFPPLGAHRDTLRSTWKPLRALFIDETSMISKEFFGEVEHRCRLVKDTATPWGDLSLRLSGCFHQLPPVAALSLIKPLPASFDPGSQPQTVAGHNLWQNIEAVIHLDFSRRCTGPLATMLADMLADKGISDASWQHLLGQCLRPRDPRLQNPQFQPTACPIGVLRHSIRAIKTLQRAHHAALQHQHRLLLAVAADRMTSANRSLILDPTLALQAAGVHNLSSTMNLPAYLCLYRGISFTLETKLCAKLGLVRGCTAFLEHIIFADAEPRMPQSLPWLPCLTYIHSMLPFAFACHCRPFDSAADLPPHPLLFMPTALILRVPGETWIKHAALGPGRFLVSPILRSWRFYPGLFKLNPAFHLMLLVLSLSAIQIFGRI